MPAVSFAATDTSATSSTDENDADETTDGGEFTWVYDAYGLLSDEQYTELEDELAEIYDEYKYDVVLAISPDIGEEHDYRKYVATFMQTNEIGYGDTHEGMCIFISRMQEILRSYSVGKRRMISQKAFRKKCWISVRKG